LFLNKEKGGILGFPGIYYGYVVGRVGVKFMEAPLQFVSLYMEVGS
jgi:hypothetical protein